MTKRASTFPGYPEIAREWHHQRGVTQICIWYDSPTRQYRLEYERPADELRYGEEFDRMSVGHSAFTWINVWRKRSLDNERTYQRWIRGD